jgi:aspartyl protease family protein
MKNDEIANIVYALLMAVLIGGGMIRHYRKKSAGYAANHAFLWVGIFTLVILGVVMFEGEGGLKQRIAGAFNPSNAITNERGEIILTKAQNGHFHVDIEINGAVIEFMIDTGASHAALSKQDAQAIGIRLSDLSYTTQTNTANGKSWSAPFMIKHMRIGATNFHNIRGSVAQGEMDGSLLGMSFLSQLQSFTIEQNRMIMVP